MHLKFELKYVQYMLATTVVFMLFFFSAVAPDVMRHDGACQRWAEENGQKICKIYSWTNAAAAAEVKHQLRRQVLEEGVLDKVAKSQSDEWAASGAWQSGSTAVNVRNAMMKQKALGLHKSYWYDKQQYSTNQLEEPAVLAMKGKQMVAGLQRNYLPIEAAMKMVVADNARPSGYSISRRF